MNDNEISKPPTELVEFSTGAFNAVCPQLDYCPSLRIEGDLDITSVEVIRDEVVRRYNIYEDLQETIAALENEKHVLEAALYEVAEIVADSDLDAMTQVAQLSMALSGVEQAGLIDGDKVGTDEQPTVPDEYL